MEEVLREALENFKQDLRANDSDVCDFDDFSLKLQNKVNVEHLKVKTEIGRERERLENANSEFQKKLRKIGKELDEFDFFSEIGIGQFIIAKHWFRETTDEFRTEYLKEKIELRDETGREVLMKEVEKVKKETSRFLKVVREELDLKLQSCAVSLTENASLRLSIDELISAVHILNSKINLVDEIHLDAHFQDLDRLASTVELLADKLVVRITNLQSQKKQMIRDELTFNAFPERFEHFISRKTHHTVDEIKNNVSSIVDEFTKENRSKNTMLELKDVQPYLLNINDAWEASYDAGIQKEREKLETLAEKIGEELVKSKDRQAKLEEQLKKAQNSQLFSLDNHNQTGTSDDGHNSVRILLQNSDPSTQIAIIQRFEQILTKQLNGNQSVVPEENPRNWFVSAFTRSCRTFCRAENHVANNYSEDIYAFIDAQEANISHLEARVGVGKSLASCTDWATFANVMTTLAYIIVPPASLVLLTPGHGFPKYVSLFSKSGKHISGAYLIGCNDSVLVDENGHACISKMGKVWKKRTEY